MPLGEEVGDAYIEVHADTSSFRRELQREAKAAGAAAGRDFGDGMDSELDSQMSRIGRRLRQSLSDAGVKSGIGFQEGLESAVVSRMRRFTANLQESMVSGDWKIVLDDFDSLDTGMHKVLDRLVSLRQQGAITEDQLKDAAHSLDAWYKAVKNDEAEQALKRMSEDLQDVGKEFLRETDKANEAIKRFSRDASKHKIRVGVEVADFQAELDRSIAAVDKANAQAALNAGEHERRITQNLANEYRKRRELNEDFINDRAEFWDREVSRASDSEKAMRRWARNAEKEMKRLRKSLLPDTSDWLDTEALDRSLARFADNVDRSFSRAGRSIDRGFIGRLKGARNDFANLVGVVGGGLERVFMKGFDAAFGAAGRAVENLGSKITNLGGPFERVGSAVQTFGSAVSTLSGGPIGQLVVTVAGFALALQALIPILGVAVAGVYGLSGALVALGVSVGGAALGALLSLGPILLAVGAGAGAAVIGIMGMTDAMKDSLDPLKEWFDEVKTAVAERLFANLEEQVEGVRGLLERLTPTLEKSADVLSGFMDEFIAAFSSDEMQAVLAPLEDLLPQILDNLLGIVKNLSTAFAGLFAAASPVVEEFTGKMEDALGTWSEWVNSAEGQEAIKDFFEKAATAAETLWDIAGQVWDVLKVLFEEGNSTGQEFLDKILELTTQFAEWLGSTEGREELQQWFEYAKEVASELGDVMSALKQVWDELNTPTNRQLFLTIIGLVEQAILWFSDLAGWVDDLNTKFLNFLMTVQNFDLATGLSNAWAGVEMWWNGTAVPWFEAIPSTLATVFGSAWDNLWNPVEERWSKVVAWWNGTAKPWFEAIPSALMTVFNTAWDNLSNPITERWSKVLAWWSGTALPWFQSLPGKAKQAFTDLWKNFSGEISKGWSGVTSWWNNTAMPWFRGLPGKLKSIGEDMIDNLLDGIKAAWSDITGWLSRAVSNIKLRIPTPSISMPNLPWNARGSIVNGAQVVGVGEAGPEAIVPLNRNLSQVDPSVRWLSAIAQGKSPIPNAGAGGSGTTIAEGAIQVFSNFADSRLVAEDVLSGLVSKFK